MVAAPPHWQYAGCCDNVTLSFQFNKTFFYLSLSRYKEESGGLWIGIINPSPNLHHKYHLGGTS